MKKYCVTKHYKDCFIGASVVFTTDTREDAELYAALMRRNSDENYFFEVHSLVPEDIDLEALKEALKK